MKFSAATLSTVAVMALGVAAQTNSTGGSNTTAPGPNGANTTAPGPGGANTTAPGPGGANTTGPAAPSPSNTTGSGNGTSNTTSGGTPKPTSAAFAIAAGSEGIVAAGVFAGLLAALV